MNPWHAFGSGRRETAEGAFAGVRTRQLDRATKVRTFPGRPPQKCPFEVSFSACGVLIDLAQSFSSFSVLRALTARSGDPRHGVFAVTWGTH
jgi:hypothetical protein